MLRGTVWIVFDLGFVHLCELDSGVVVHRFELGVQKSHLLGEVHRLSGVAENIEGAGHRQQRRAAMF